MCHMIPKFEFDLSSNDPSISEDRNVLNDSDKNTSCRVHINDKISPTRINLVSDSVRFTEDSKLYTNGIEDEYLLSGKATPSKTGELYAGPHYSSKVYDPMEDLLIGQKPSPLDIELRKNKKSSRIKPSSEAFGKLNLFKDTNLLLISSVIFLLLILLELVLIWLIQG